MKLAAVPYDAGRGNDLDELLASLAHGLLLQGWRLAGAVQTNEPRADGCRCDMTLEDLASGRRIGASENRGRHAGGCRLDTSALEEAVGLSLSALSAATDLVIVNRFGKTEAEGKGFRAVIEAAINLGIPVVIGVNQAQLAAWQEFSGGAGAILEAEAKPIRDWCEAASADCTPMRCRPARDTATRHEAESEFRPAGTFGAG